MNPFFKRQFVFKKDDISPIYDVFADKTQTDSLKAQLILLLHASKMDGDYGLFSLFFQNIKTVQVLEVSEANFYEFFKDLYGFINYLVANQSIKDLVSRVIYKLCESYPDLSCNLKISFFKSKIIGLYGFAGVTLA